jgi:hypothetical protein
VNKWFTRSASFDVSPRGTTRVRTRLDRVPRKRIRPTKKPIHLMTARASSSLASKLDPES